MSKRNKKKNIGKNVKKTLWDKVKENKKAAGYAGLGALLVIASIFIVIILNSNPLFDTYQTGDLLYLSPLSNVPADSYEDSYQEVTVSKKEFIVTQENLVETVTNPEYRTEQMTEELAESMKNAMIGENYDELFDGVKKVHYIYDEDGGREDFILLEKEDGLLFVQYYIVNEKLDIWHVMELED